MHKGFLVAVAVAALPALALASSAGDGAGRIFPYRSHVETLENGLRVILVPMSSHGLVAYWTVVRTGSRDEYEPGRTGFAHFFEHMMFQGTEAFPQEVYGATATRMGADANAYTTDDLTAYHLGIAAEDLETAMQIESDRFRNLAYAKPDFETEAGAVYGEYRKNRMNPFFAVYEAVHETAFDRHTYGHTTMGFERDIKGMPELYDYSRTFFSRYYRPENVVLLIAGELDPGSVMERVRHYYGEWEPGYVAPRIEPEPPQREERTVDVAYEGQTLPIVWIAYKGPAFDPGHREWAALSLLGELAFGETSAIHKQLVLDEQVVEFIAGDLGMNRDPGLFDIYTRVKDPDKIAYVRERIDAAIRHHRETPPDARRLADLKSRLRYEFLMNLDTPDRVASAMARIVAVTGGIEAVEQLYAGYAAITPEEVRAAAERYLVPSGRTVAVLRGSGR